MTVFNKNNWNEHICKMTAVCFFSYEETVSEKNRLEPSACTILETDIMNCQQGTAASASSAWLHSS